MRTYEFFHGLDGDGVDVSLDEYCNKATWGVKAMGHNEDGFWLLLENPFEPVD